MYNCFCTLSAPPKRRNYEESEGSTTEEEESEVEGTHDSSDTEEEEEAPPPKKSQRRSQDGTARRGRPSKQMQSRDRGGKRSTEEEVPASRAGSSRRAPSDLSVSYLCHVLGCYEGHPQTLDCTQ